MNPILRAGSSAPENYRSIHCIGSSTVAAETKTLNIGWTGGSGWTALPDRVAAERGFYEKEGLRVRYIEFQGTNLMLSALMSNELDYLTILPFIAGAATRGLPVKIVAATAKSSGYAIVSRPESTTSRRSKEKKSPSTPSAVPPILRSTNC